MLISFTVAGNVFVSDSCILKLDSSGITTLDEAGIIPKLFGVTPTDNAGIFSPVTMVVALIPDVAVFATVSISIPESRVSTMLGSGVAAGLNENPLVPVNCKAFASGALGKLTLFGIGTGVALLWLL